MQYNWNWYVIVCQRVKRTHWIVPCKQKRLIVCYITINTRKNKNKNKSESCEKYTGINNQEYTRRPRKRAFKNYKEERRRWSEYIERHRAHLRLARWALGQISDLQNDSVITRGVKPVSFWWLIQHHQKTTTQMSCPSECQEWSFLTVLLIHKQNFLLTR